MTPVLAIDSETELGFSPESGQTQLPDPCTQTPHMKAKPDHEQCEALFAVVSTASGGGPDVNNVHNYAAAKCASVFLINVVVHVAVAQRPWQVRNIIKRANRQGIPPNPDRTLWGAGRQTMQHLEPCPWAV